MRKVAWVAVVGLLGGGCGGSVATGVCGEQCGGDTSHGGAGGVVHVETGGAASSGGSSGNSGVGGLLFESGGTNGAGGAPACGVQGFVDGAPIDMLVLVDQSAGMGDPLPDGTSSWWAAASGGLTDFFTSRDALSVAVGIQFFSQGGTAPDSCQFDYATPEVEVDALPGNADALVASVARHSPTTFRATAPALSGAIAHMKSLAPSRHGRAPVVVLMTNGFPTECEPTDIASLDAIARAGFDTEPRVRTYVVAEGLGQSAGNLTSVARAGGGTFLSVDDGDVRKALSLSLLSVRIPALGATCSTSLPKPPGDQFLDPSRLNLSYTPSGGSPFALFFVTDASGCGDGWYFDDPTTPTKVFLCPETCRYVGSGDVQIQYGCHRGPVTK